MIQKKPILLVIPFLLLYIGLAPALADSKNPVVLEFFYSSHCSDCEEKIPVIEQIENEFGDNVTVYWKDISTDENALEDWKEYNLLDVPAVVVNGRTRILYDDITEENLKEVINAYLSGNISFEENKTGINIPFLGFISEENLSEFSLPILAIVLGFIDGFNPCSFFVLMVLLSLLVYAGSRRKIFLIGGIFIFFSGFIYFLFMSLLTGVFVLTSHINLITIVAGCVALFLASLNIKDFFFFKKGISASIPESKKPKLYRKMRTLIKATRMSSLIIGTIVLAISANTYELFCTLGFPMIFTRILTLNNLPVLQYYFYLLIYNIAYVAPLAIIVSAFAFTLDRKKLTASHGRFLKLLSGMLMLSLGFILLVNPNLLNNLLMSIGILLIAIVFSVLIYMIYRKTGKI